MEPNTQSVNPDAKQCISCNEVTHFTFADVVAVIVTVIVAFSSAAGLELIYHFPFQYL